jgi:hypothetical protein
LGLGGGSGTLGRCGSSGHASHFASGLRRDLFFHGFHWLGLTRATKALVDAILLGAGTGPLKADPATLREHGVGDDCLR